MPQWVDSEFFEKSPLEVAPRMIGMLLYHNNVVARIVETEAYGGSDDPASHAYRGVTNRCAQMFQAPGRAYVYFTYGSHFCLNVVCQPQDRAAAVLIRAAEVIEGEEEVAERLGARRSLGKEKWLSGPGRLCRALGIDRSFNGVNMTCEEFEHGLGEIPFEPVLLLALDGARTTAPSCGPRVGISVAADRPWRFFDPNSPAVSLYRSAKRKGILSN